MGCSCGPEYVTAVSFGVVLTFDDQRVRCLIRGNNGGPRINEEFTVSRLSPLFSVLFFPLSFEKYPI